MLDFLAANNAENVAVFVAPNMNAALYAELARHNFGSGVGGGQQIQWQEPGFAALFQQRGAEMGQPLDLPHSDDLGNVFQESVSGSAVWINHYNANFWLPKPAGLAFALPAARIARPTFPPDPPIAPGAVEAPAGAGQPAPAG